MRILKNVILIFIILLFSCNRNLVLEKQKIGEKFSKVNISLFEKLVKTDSSKLKLAINTKIHIDEFHKTDDYWITVQNDSSLTTYFIDKQRNKIVNIQKDFWDTKNTTRAISNYYPNGNLKNIMTHNYSKKSLNNSYFQNISQNNTLLYAFSYTETKELDRVIFFDDVYKYSVEELINNLYKYVDDKDSEINIDMIYANDFTNTGLYKFEVPKYSYPFWGVSYFNKDMKNTKLLLFDGINGKLLSTQDSKLQISTDDYGGQERYYLQEHLKWGEYFEQQDSIWNEINE